MSVTDTQTETDRQTDNSEETPKHLFGGELAQVEGVVAIINWPME